MPNPRKHKLPLASIARCLLGWVMLSLASCESGPTVFHAYHSFGQEAWARHDTVVFNVEIPDSSVAYTLHIEARNSNHYRHSALPLALRLSEGDSTVLYTDTLPLIFADDNGIWTGKGLGRLYQTETEAGNLTFRHTGMHRLRLTYLLPDSLLTGISDIGIRLYP